MKCMHAVAYVNQLLVDIVTIIFLQNGMKSLTDAQGPATFQR